MIISPITIPDELRKEVKAEVTLSTIEGIAEAKTFEEQFIMLLAFMVRISDRIHRQSIVHTCSKCGRIITSIYEIRTGLCFFCSV